MKRLVIPAAALAVAAAAALYLTAGDETGEVLEDARSYIEAMRSRDFDRIFSYHGDSQRKCMIVTVRANGGDVTAELEAVRKLKRSNFETASFSEDLIGEWVEKAIFTPPSSYHIVGVDMVEDTENPSSPLHDINERVNAFVTVEVSYPSADRAPVFGGRPLKSGRFVVKMVHSSNIARTLRGEATIDRWLFKSIRAVPESMEFFD
ncbi:MAG TPA: hypothetical protein ENJ37_01040 [Deltaproteobacteria bacterium]|nr:hypothetical protein [Deltaproteobacteria bacterium]